MVESENRGSRPEALFLAQLFKMAPFGTFLPGYLRYHFLMSDYGRRVPKGAIASEFFPRVASPSLRQSPAQAASTRSLEPGSVDRPKGRKSFRTFARRKSGLKAKALVFAPVYSEVR